MVGDARVWLLVLAACGDNRVVPLEIDAPRPIDAADDQDALVDIDAPIQLGPPDLTLVAGQMDTSIQITNTVFTPTSCEVVEQCVGGVGVRRLLRFDTVTANLGEGDLIVGSPPGVGVDDPPFVWSPCHGHHHVTGYAIYELLDGNGNVIGGHKQAFCLQDIQQVEAGAPSHGYDCSNQGLSKGWADVYSRTLPCQWIDITGMAPGAYTLRVRINPMATFPDSNASNNLYQHVVVI